MFRKSLRIVYYHLVSNENPTYSLSKKILSLKRFSNQIIDLKKKYNIISLDTAYEMFLDKKGYDTNLVITFDDGFKEIYHSVYPILQREKITGTVYLISNCINNNNLMWRNKLSYLQKTNKQKFIDQACSKLSSFYNVERKLRNENLMQWSSRSWLMNVKDSYSNFLWDQLSDIGLNDFLKINRPYLITEEIEELAKHGWSFGSHSKSHPLFSKLNEEEALREIEESIHSISALINLKYLHFSYPFGVRMKQKFESTIAEKLNLNTMVGTRNNFNNYTNPFKWERDRLEVGKTEEYFRFYILPTLRHYFI